MFCIFKTQLSKSARPSHFACLCDEIIRGKELHREGVYFAHSSGHCPQRMPRQGSKSFKRPAPSWPQSEERSKKSMLPSSCLSPLHSRTPVKEWSRNGAFHSGGSPRLNYRITITPHRSAQRQVSQLSLGSVQLAIRAITLYIEWQAPRDAACRLESALVYFLLL